MVIEQNSDLQWVGGGGGVGKIENWVCSKGEIHRFIEVGEVGGGGEGKRGSSQLF